MIGWILGLLGVSAGDGSVVGWLDLGLSAVGLFAVIASRTPNKVDDKVAQLLADLINFLGANVGKAKNALIVMALVSVATLGMGCAQIRPFLHAGCGLLGVEIRVGTVSTSLDLCNTERDPVPEPAGPGVLP